VSVPFTAQRLAFERRARPGSGKLINDEVLRELVAERLKKRWSPEQISHVLREEFLDQPEGYLVPETDLPGGLPARAGRPGSRVPQGTVR